jgi:hypothetical protein
MFFWGNMGNLEIFSDMQVMHEKPRDLLRSFVVSVDGFTWCFPSPRDGSQELEGLVMENPIYIYKWIIWGYPYLRESLFLVVFQCRLGNTQW